MKVVIEKTSKSLKLCLLVGWLGLLAGIGIMIGGNMEGGTAVLILAILWLLVVKALIWWNHA